MALSRNVFASFNFVSLQKCAVLYLTLNIAYNKFQRPTEYLGRAKYAIQYGTFALESVVFSVLFRKQKKKCKEVKQALVLILNSDARVYVNILSYIQIHMCHLCIVIVIPSVSKYVVMGYPDIFTHTLIHVAIYSYTRTTQVRRQKCINASHTRLFVFMTLV